MQINCICQAGSLSTYCQVTVVVFWYTSALFKGDR